MDRFSTLADRLRHAGAFLAGCFGVGFAIGLWDPQPKLVLTVALGICVGMLMLGPYAAAAVYGLQLQRFLRGHLRWPLCVLLAASTVLLLDHFLRWSTLQLALAGITALVGTVLGHDATLVVLELRHARRLDPLMVGLFPVLLGLCVMAGYSSFGFALGTYRFLAALVGS